MTEKSGYSNGYEAIWYLRKYNFFPCLNEEDMMQMATSANMVRVTKGGIIYFPEETAESIYLIKEGHVRLSRLLLRFADEFPGRTNLGHRMVRLRLTHQDIADLIGANRERVSSVLSRMQADGLISTVHRMFSLHNEDGLKTIALGEPSAYNFETKM